MTESEIQKEFTKSLRANIPGAVVIKHSDGITSGIPDNSVTWHYRTSWIELKVERNGKRIEKLIQKLMMIHLARQGFAFYVIFTETGVKITKPISRGREIVLLEYEGHDFKPIFHFIKELHGDQRIWLSY